MTTMMTTMTTISNQTTNKNPLSVKLKGFFYSLQIVRILYGHFPFVFGFARITAVYVRWGVIIQQRKNLFCRGRYAVIVFVRRYRHVYSCVDRLACFCRRSLCYRSSCCHSFLLFDFVCFSYTSPFSKRLPSTRAVLITARPQKANATRRSLVPIYTKDIPSRLP